MLLHVLVTGAVVALIAASLLRLATLRYQVTARAQQATVERRSDEGAMARIISAWNAANQNCTAVPGYSVSGSAGSCSCTLNPSSSGDPTVTAYMSGGNCTLKLVSSDSMH